MKGYVPASDQYFFVFYKKYDAKNSAKQLFIKFSLGINEYIITRIKTTTVHTYRLYILYADIGYM